jgi:hypothetical protein
MSEPRPSSAHRRVVFLPGTAQTQGHDTIAKESLAASLAQLLGADYGGSVESAPGAVAGAYTVPCETLGRDEAARLGIDAAHDLFGGVAPRPFIATKAITHPLVAADAQAPEGWAPAFAQRVAAVVLDGRSAFTAGDARRACIGLLRDGAVRVKDVAGVGGAGQAVVTDLRQFDALLASKNVAAPWQGGLVLERNLHRVRTVSVGQVCVGGWLLSYHGQQRLTRNHRGDEVYGGSSLHLVRGDFEALLHADLSDALRLAIEQALVYHRAALSTFDGLFASRCNYDVAQGVDDAGLWRSGVLEQSWRIGGASGAEIAALHAFRDQPALRWVDASTHEIYADDAVAPPGARVHFDGRDAKVGRLLKYALVDGRGDD